MFGLSEPFAKATSAHGTQSRLSSASAPSTRTLRSGAPMRRRWTRIALVLTLSRGGPLGMADGQHRAMNGAQQLARGATDEKVA